jgi:hypothetical protein
MMRIAILLIITLSEISTAQGHGPVGPREPICKGLAGTPEWGVKLLGDRYVRFTIDASLVDTCTEYYDLEFVAELLNSQGAAVATRRFAAPNIKISGPTIRSFDFSYREQEVARIRGLALRCKKRKIGGLPEAPGDSFDDPVIGYARSLTRSFEAEKKSYQQWLGVNVEYYEAYIRSSNQMVCSGGSLEKTGTQGDSSTCSDVVRAAEELAKKKYDQFGAPVLPEPNK